VDEQVASIVNIETVSGQTVVVGNNTIVNQGETAYDVRGLPNPYLGLSSYTYANRAIFAGRERNIAAALANLTNAANPQPLTFVTGASGSGKSSFAQAGLLPALEAFYQGRGLAVRWAVFRPGQHPRTALADALIQTGLAQGLAVDLQAKLVNAQAVNDLLASTPRQQVNILVLDQFEELFSQSEADERGLLLITAATLSPFRTSHTHIIATVRSDYLPALFGYPSLYEVSKQGVDLRAMAVDELKAAIQKPLQLSASHKQFEPALLERLAVDTAADAAYLPLLQVTLEELWRGGLLMLAQYHDLTFALRQRAADVLTYSDYAGVRQQLRPLSEQQTIISIFLDLVQVSLDDQLADVRCQRGYDELVGTSAERVRLLKDLSDARLVSISREQEHSRVDLIHETLIRNWPYLQAAIKDERLNLQQRERFEQSLAEWVAHNKGADYLLAGVWLAEARALQERDDVALHSAAARDLLARSTADAEAVQQRQLKLAQDAAASAQQAAFFSERARKNAETITRRTRIASAAVSIFLIISLLLTFFAYGQYIEAQKQTNEVTAQRQQVLAAYLNLAASTKLRQNNPLGALRLILSAYDKATPERRREKGYVTLLSLTLEQSSIGQTLFKYRPPRSAAISSSHRSGLFLSPQFDIGEGGSFGMAHLTISHDGRHILATLNRLLLLADAEGNLLALLVPPAGSPGDGIDDDPSARLGLPVSTAIFAADDRSVLLADQLEFASSRGGPGAGSVIQWDITNPPTAQEAAKFSQVDQLPPIKGTMLLSTRQTFATNIAVSPDNRLLLTSGISGTATIWQRDGLRQVASLPDNSLFVTPAFSLDSQRVLTISDSKHAALWQISGPSSRLLTTLAHTATITTVAFGPDGQMLTLSGGQLHLWDKVGQPLASNSYASTPTPDDQVSGNKEGASFSRDGKQIIIASSDGLFLFAADGKLVSRLSNDRSSDATFGPGGLRILAVQAGAAHQHFSNLERLQHAAECREAATPLGIQQRRTVDATLAEFNQPPSDPAAEAAACKEGFDWAQQ